MVKKSKATVLVVEDDGILSKILASHLEEEGFKVLAAENGKAGLELAFKHHPTVILLDIVMPVMDGYTMLDKLRDDKWGSSVYVFLLSNTEPTDDLLTEAMRVPYRSEYMVKANIDIGDVIKMVKKRIETELKNK